MTDRADIYSTFVERFSDGELALLPSEDDLEQIETEFQTRLPRAYREFIKRHGCIQTPSLLDSIEEQEVDLWDIAAFNEPRQITETAQMYLDDGLADNLIPFASDSMGNMFCFSSEVSGTALDDAAVFIFDHDFCEVTKLADSFDSWLEQYLNL